MSTKALFFGFVGLAFLILVFSTLGLIAQGKGYVYITAEEQGILGFLGFRKRSTEIVPGRDYQILPYPPDEIEKLKIDLEKQATISSRTRESTTSSSPLPTTSPGF